MDENKTKAKQEINKAVVIAWRKYSLSEADLQEILYSIKQEIKSEDDVMPCGCSLATFELELETGKFVCPNHGNSLQSFGEDYV